MLVQRIGFRLLFCYFALYLVLCWLFEERFGMAGELGLPGANFIVGAYAKLWARVVCWIGNRLFHPANPTPSTWSCKARSRVKRLRSG